MNTASWCGRLQKLQSQIDRGPNCKTAVHNNRNERVTFSRRNRPSRLLRDKYRKTASCHFPLEIYKYGKQWIPLRVWQHFIERQKLDEREDATLLKAFVVVITKASLQTRSQQLQLLIRLSEKISRIYPAGRTKNLPNLPKLWSFVQLCDLADVKDMQAQQLKSAGKSISDFATVLRQSMPNENTTVENQRSLSFMMPLYMGENEKVILPTYMFMMKKRKIMKPV